MAATWQIVEGPYGLAVQTETGKEAWPHFFPGIALRAYPKLIETVAREVGYHSNAVGVNFPAGLAQLEPNAAPIPADSVAVYVADEEEVIPRTTFYAALLAFGERLLERPGQPESWYAAMRVALNKLQAKMTADAADA